MDANRKATTRKRLWIFGGGFFILLLAISLWPRANKIHGEGTLDPEVKREVQNPHSNVAFLTESYVEGGDSVKEGQSLFLLSDEKNITEIKELETKVSTANGQYRTAWLTLQNSRGSLDTAEKAKLAAEVTAKSNEKESLTAQLDHARSVGKKLLVSSPVSGYISEPKNLKSLVGKGFSPEKPILTITDPKSEWYVWLWLPEEGIGPVTRQESKTPGKTMVKFFLNGDPSTQYDGVVHAIRQEQESLKENEKVKKLLIIVKIDPKQLGLDNEKITGVLQGATVTGNVYCETTTNIQYYGRKFFSWLYKARFNA